MIKDRREINKGVVGAKPLLAKSWGKSAMAFEFIQIPANGQGSAKEELNKLLRNGRIASVKKEFVSNGEDSFWAFCIEFLEGIIATDKSRSVGILPTSHFPTMWARRPHSLIRATGMSPLHISPSQL